MAYLVRKLLSLILAAVLAAGVAAAFSVPGNVMASPSVTITVYNWGQYISDGSDGYIDVISAFEEEYPDIHVNYLTYDSNETMYSKLKTGGAAYDVIIPSDYMIETLINEGMLLELDYSNIPNFEYIDDTFRNPSYDPENKYSVPYTWGRVGIIYNSLYVNEDDLTGWDILWNPSYAGKILMFDNCRDAFAIAELRLGMSLNTEDEESLTAAAELLKEQKNLVQSYVMDQIFDKMERAEAWLAPYYAGDYIFMLEENPDLGFFEPEEGYNIFVDAMCIPASSQHRREAELFINFVTDPAVCGENLEYLGYSAPSSAAKEYMDEDLAGNEVAYPDEEELERGEYFGALSTEGIRTMNSLWLDVKTSGDNLSLYIWVTAGTVAAILILWLIIEIRKKRRIARRCTNR